MTSSHFDSLVDSVGTLEKYLFPQNSQNVKRDIMLRLVMLMVILFHRFGRLWSKSKVDEIEEDVINTMNAVIEIYEMLL